MAFHFPLMPRMFMALRREDRRPIVEIIAADAGDPRQLPVGDLPAQPRRADARDGDRRGARLHVPRVRRDPRMRINIGIRRRLAPLLDNGRRADRAAATRCCSRCPGRRSSTTATRSAWATTSTWRPQRRAHADAVDGDRNAGFSGPTPQQLYLPVVIDPGTTATRRSTSRRSAQPHRCLHWMRRLIACASATPSSAAARSSPLPPANRVLVIRAYEETSSLRAQPVALRPGGGDRPARFKGLRRRSRCRRAALSPASVSSPTSSRPRPDGFYWFQGLGSR